jgi:hypothetical protein
MNQTRWNMDTPSDIYHMKPRKPHTWRVLLMRSKQTNTLLVPKQEGIWSAAL